MESLSLSVEPQLSIRSNISKIEAASAAMASRISDETNGCNDCRAHQCNGEDLPLISRSGKWFARIATRLPGH
jgi:hypothetical protein